MFRLALMLFLSLFFHQAWSSDGLIKRLEHLQSLRATFDQVEFETDDLAPQRQRGSLWMQRPGDLRWLIEEPQQEWFLLKDTLMYHYESDLNQVTLSDLSGMMQDLPLYWLLHPQSLLENFDIQSRTLEAGVDRYELIPKENKPYQRLILTFDGEHLDQLEVDTGVDRTLRIRFYDMQTNSPIPDSTFVYVKPQGASELR